MTLDEAITKRRSVRRFQDRPVPDLRDVLALASKGPSAGGIRGYKAMVTHQRLGPYEAPVYVAICVDQGAYEPRYGGRGRDLYSIQDAAIFGAYLQLLLVDRGLASCWIGAFREGRVQRALGTTLLPVALIAVGYEA